MADTVRLVGEGGAVFTFDVQRLERGPFADQLAKGRLRPKTKTDARKLGAAAEPDESEETE